MLPQTDNTSDNTDNCESTSGALTLGVPDFPEYPQGSCCGILRVEMDPKCPDMRLSTALQACGLTMICFNTL